MSNVPGAPPPPAPPAGQPVTVVPVAYAPPRRSALGWLVRFFFALLFLVSLGLNLILMSQVPGCGETTIPIEERYHSGQRLARDKIAVVKIDGVIMEGMTGFVRKQIDRAAADDGVKAVVVRVNSPGGSITASDELYKRLCDLRDGTLRHEGGPDRRPQPKPLVVSMGSLAASGGYYISMPAKTLFAERCTITGSIGVYAAFPNVKELSNKIGFRMDVIKAGRIKDSGSPFEDLQGQARQVWESMVDHAYLQFLDVVEHGRPQLKGKLQEDIVIQKTVPVRSDQGSDKAFHFTRYRADGGIFTADEAKQYGLIDQIGYLDDAIQAARQAAGLGEDFRVVTYEKPVTLVGMLTGTDSSDLRLDPKRLAAGALPRLWYLAPQCELAGLLQAAQE